MDTVKIMTKELKVLAYSLYDSIYVLECFRSHDLCEYIRICNELEDRGYELEETSKLRIRKKLK